MLGSIIPGNNARFPACAFLQPENVVVGRDVRLGSPRLAAALMRGLNDSRVDVLDIGLCGTEEVYFATFNRDAGAGIMVTASHNPKGYNGMKLVCEQYRHISNDSGLLEIRKLAESGISPSANCAAQTIDQTDGISLEFPEWRFNVRTSNTEPLLRLNVETRGNAALLREKTEELRALIGAVHVQA